MSNGLPKTGSLQTHKERLLNFLLSDFLSENQVRKYAEGDDSVLPGTSSSSSSAIGPANDHQEPVVASGGGDGEKTGSDAPVLFGRQTFSLVPGDDGFEDKTNFFADVEQGPSIKNAKNSIAEAMSQATDGVIPLAACIKVSQGFKETCGAQVALLLAGF